jgi:hypothetical protein
MSQESTTARAECLIIERRFGEQRLAKEAEERAAKAAQAGPTLRKEKS